MAAHVAVSPDVRLAPDLRRALILAWKQIDTVIDVGANAGQYGHRIRQLGFTGGIHSFEPLAGPFDQLRRATENDPVWSCQRLALASHDGIVPR